MPNWVLVFLVAFAFVFVAELLPVIMGWILAPYVVREAERIVEG
jgi:hypothetical protein